MTAEHPYICHVLQNSGFGRTFKRNIETIYHNAQGMVKCSGMLTAPLRYATAVRQGDPLSGPLFALTTEPFRPQPTELLSPAHAPHCKRWRVLTSVINLHGLWYTIRSNIKCAEVRKEQKARTYAHMSGNTQTPVYFSSAIFLLKTFFTTEYSESIMQTSTMGTWMG